MVPKPQLTGGDELDDDFVPDNIVALSGGESDAEEIEAALSGTEEATTEPVPQISPTNETIEKKRKRREKEKEKKAKRIKVAETMTPSEDVSIAAASPSELAKYLKDKQLKSFSNFSEIELEDKAIPEAAIADTTSWTGPRTLDNIVDFISKTLPTLRTRFGQKPKNNGAPTLLFVSAAALRVTDVTRALKSKTLRGEKGGDVAKLFARHFKFEDHVTYLRRTKLAAAAGTPGRIGKLLCDTDALGTSALTHIMLDVSFRDAKKRSLLDIPETRDEVFKLVLGAPRVAKAIQEGKLQVVLF